MKSLILIIMLSSFSFFDCKVDEEFLNVKECIPYEGTTVIIGNQIWTAENYKVNYPGSKVYNDDEANRELYGGMYNYSMLLKDDFAPCGFHVPTQDEWHTMWMLMGIGADDYYCIASTDQGGILKSVRTDPDAHPRWNSPNVGANDFYGFGVLPGGLNNGDYFGIGERAFFWGLDSVGAAYGYDVEILVSDSKLHISILERVCFASVRFVKD